ncbi:MAG: hypothetical protein ACRC41_12430 [Sarcina sp.]
MKENIELINLAIKILEFIRECDDVNLKLLLDGKKELKIVDLVAGELKIGNKNDESGKKCNGTGEEDKFNERRSITKESKCKSIEEEKENTKKKKRGISSQTEKVEELNEFDIYIRELSRFRTKEEANKYLLENKLTVTKLKILAKKLAVYIKSKSKKEDIVESIVEGIVGSRLKLESLRGY